MTFETASVTAEEATRGAEEARRRGRTLSGEMLAMAWSTPQFKVALGIFLALALAAIIWPLLSPMSSTTPDIGNRFVPPIFMEGGKWPHFFGTDQLGRDLFLRSLVGLQIALMIGVVSTVLMFLLGCAVGLLSGYRGGWTDVILMRLTDAQMSIPLIILAITILGLARPNYVLIIAVLVLASWPVYARVARSAAMAEKEREYVRGLRILGASDFRIMLLHIAPNILPPIAFVAVLDVARMMIFEAIFGFIGIGIQPPTPTFGRIIADGTQYLINAWWITTVPGVLLFLMLGSLNVMGASLERARNKLLKGIG